MAPYDEEEISPDDLLTNMIVMGASLIVIAAVVIGVVAGVDSKGGPGKLGENVTLDNMMGVDEICNQTDYKESCMASLQPVGDKASVKKYLTAAINGTVSEMTNAMQKAKVNADAIGDQSLEKMALEDCVELMGLSIEEMQSVMPLEDVGDGRSSLSAVIAYQRACVEGLKESLYASFADFDGGLQKARELASIILAIIYENFPNDDARVERQLMADQRKVLQDYKKAGGQMIPHASVAKDGSEEYGSINAALDAYPNDIKGRYVIYVKAGVYEENVVVAKNKTNVFMYGDGVTETIISGTNLDDTTTYRRATLSAIGNEFICANIGIKVPDKSSGNSIAALKIQSDKAAFYNCRINGTTSNIYALAHRQFFKECEIYGVTNIIKGDAALVIQRSKIVVTQPSTPVANIITLQGRSDKRENTGFVIHGSVIVADESNSPEKLKNWTYLGMAVDKYSRTIVMESLLGDLINAQGWSSSNNYGIENVTFAEYKNRGPGAQTKNRVNWPSHTVITNRNDALLYTADRFIELQKWSLDNIIGPLHAGLFS
ncbi:pectinesterase-like [Corylus avellana]|uniref:pectinesterase-like n=1 Tax=Corylus avellana TaxID=13451 RepID=UPI00286A2A26|nr:pectinesterase-like [Corylus avellana]